MTVENSLEKKFIEALDYAVKNNMYITLLRGGQFAVTPTKELKILNTNAIAAIAQGVLNILTCTLKMNEEISSTISLANRLSSALSDYCRRLKRQGHCVCLAEGHYRIRKVIFNIERVITKYCLQERMKKTT